ncbi:MAG TPA: ABC transporter ATP-binding protein, partial [Candidatus Saccharimonadales bacterium]|nr:ABC transporter ATP-binding protein [Candidatus Saccharimonadales bacterium]
MTLLVATDLVRRFRGLAAVDSLSFEVREGEVMAIIGPNGAGKTTLFNLLSGLLAANAGRIEFDGADITAARPHRRCHLGLGRTFQLVQPFADLTVLENVMVGALFGGAGSASSTARANAATLCERVGLGLKRDASVSSLTVADRKRLELARALATRPRLLLLDEIMEGLTPNEEREAVQLVREIRGEGVTLLLIEHIMSTVRDLSDRVLVMDHGKKIAEGDYAAVSRDPAVIEA